MLPVKSLAPLVLGLVLGLVLVPAGAVHAGSACEDRPMKVEDLQKSLQLALATRQALDDSGADVVLLARSGQNLGDYGLEWSHLAFAYKDIPSGQPGEAPVWRVLHKLNHCGTARADLFRQGLGEFYLDGIYRNEGSFAVLRPDLQQALLPVLRDNTRPAALHSAGYNMLAYPWALKYQQSNQWVTETLAAAAGAGEIVDRSQAQDWLRSHGYRPSTLQISAAKRLGARLSRANIAFDDQPVAERMQGHIQTTTADSVFAWTARSGLAAPNRRITPAALETGAIAPPG